MPPPRPCATPSRATRPTRRSPRTSASTGAGLLLATPAELATLAREAQPVYRMLEADPQTRRFIRQIRAWKRTTPSGSGDVQSRRAAGTYNAPRTRAGRAQAASLLDGTYRWVLTRDDAHRYWGPQLNPGDTLSLDRHRDLAARHVAPRRPRRRSRDVRDPRQPHSVRLAARRLRARVHVHPDGDGTLHLKPVLPMDPGDQFVWACKPWQRIGPPTQTAR